MSDNNVISGRKYRAYLDPDNNKWSDISFWTLASDVEFSDGKNAEEKIEEITQNFQNGCNDIYNRLYDAGVVTASYEDTDLEDIADSLERGNLIDTYNGIIHSSYGSVLDDEQLLSSTSLNNLNIVVIDDVDCSRQVLNINQYGVVTKVAYDNTDFILVPSPASNLSRGYVIEFYIFNKELNDYERVYVVYGSFTLKTISGSTNYTITRTNKRIYPDGLTETVYNGESATVPYRAEHIQYETLADVLFNHCPMVDYESVYDLSRVRIVVSADGAFKLGFNGTGDA